MFERFLSFVYICSSAFCVYFNLMTTYGLQDILKVSAYGRPARGDTPAHRRSDEWRTCPSVAWRNGLGQDFHYG